MLDLSPVEVIQLDHSLRDVKVEDLEITEKLKDSIKEVIKEKKDNN